MSWTILIPIGIALINAFWLVLVLVGLPGTWLIIATCALADWWLGMNMFSPYVLIAAVTLSALGEIMELLAGSHGARKAGGGKRGSWGALGGGIAGAILGTMFIPIPILGSLIGAGLGAFAAAAALEHDGGQDLTTAFQIGRGAAWGQFMGTLLKLIVGILVWLLVTVASFL